MSLGSGGGSGSPPRRLRLAEPLPVVPWYIASLPSGIVGSTSFQLNTTRAVLACGRYKNFTAKIIAERSEAERGLVIVT